MDSKSSKAAEYRKMAASCMQVAERVSLKADRERMREMAQRWLELAKQTEAANEAALLRIGL